MPSLLLLVLCLPLWASDPPPVVDWRKELEGLGKSAPAPGIDTIQKYIDQTFGSLEAKRPGAKPTVDAFKGWRNVGPSFDPRRAGGNVSGGGSVIEIDGRWRLLDTYAFAHLVPKPAEPGLLPSRLERTPFHESVGVDIWDVGQSDAFKVVANRVREIAAPQERLALLILGILKYKVKFFYAFERVKRYSDFYLPAHVGPQKVRTVILYDPLFGPVIDAQLWNELDLNTQAGLLIHEAFRFLRMVHPSAITERQLQHLTAAILSGIGGKTLQVQAVLGPPLYESLKRPGWNNAHETAEGTRFRLYFRRILEQMTHLRSIIAENPDRHRVTEALLDEVPLPCRTPETHEKNEVDCGGYFLAKAIHWSDRRDLDPEALELFRAMRLEDGNSGLIWEMNGKPSFLFFAFYNRLGQAVGVEQPRAINHPWSLRLKLNGGEEMTWEEHSDVAYFAGLVKAYLEARVWDQD